MMLRSAASPGGDLGAGMTLLAALGVRRREVISLVGGGGKTTLALRLVAEATARGGKAVFTVTTHIYPPDLPLLLTSELPTGLPGALPEGACCVAAARAPEEKLAGLDPKQVDKLSRHADLTVVEADGSRGLPLKFPLAHEPVIPASSTLVLPMVGATVAGQPLTPAHVHRAEAAAAFLGVPLGTSLTPAMVARLLWHSNAATRGRPASARVVPVINQADSPDRLAFAEATAGELLRLGAPRVLLTSAASPDPLITLKKR